MVSVCLYFHVHQPTRIRHYRIFDINTSTTYFDDEKNKEIIDKIKNKCYLPMNSLLLKLIKKHKGKFKISFSITGILLEQLEKYAPEVLESFKELAKTGCVEFVSETYYHSLASIYSKDEFAKQIELQNKILKKHFDATPTTFRNTELIFNNEIAKFVEDLGYKAILCEGADKVLDWKSPNFVYGNTYAKNIKLLTKNYKLSDDIAFRFSNKSWVHYPLNIEKYVEWINNINGNGNVINLFMDYETFGEHQWKDTGIFKFMELLPEKILEHPSNNFVTVSKAAKYPKVGDLDINDSVSWADTERDLTAWNGNNIQKNALKELYSIEKNVFATKNKKIINQWRKLTTSDHFYYMCTKYFNDGDVHKYFSPYESPYEAYINFMNVLNDLVKRIETLNEENYKIKQKTISKIKKLKVKKEDKQDKLKESKKTILTELDLSETPSKMFIKKDKTLKIKI